MTTKGPDVFSLRDAVVGDYRKFATSFTTIHADDIREQIHAIYARDRYWPDPLIQINPNYLRTTKIDHLVASGDLQPVTADIFRTPPTREAPEGEGLTLYKHQEESIALALSGASFVVTTGTGSGKSLCFFIPIVNAVLDEKRTDPRPRTRAVVIYPMNALANSQMEEIDKFVQNVAGPRPVTFARYTGQDDTEERQRIADNPPDILLTNFMMLELLMTRQDDLDRKVIANCAGLRFLVLDELHTYRGRQGADVALLVRRVRERLAPDRLQCIGTSATMASEGSTEDKCQVVAQVASRLFAVEIPPSNVIVERLERLTDPTLDADKVRTRLGPAIDAGIAPTVTDEELHHHPLAIWVETRLGMTWSEPDQRWVRARPLTLDEAARQMSVEADRSEAACRATLRTLLLVSSQPEAERTGALGASPRSFFAFKLHQFISGAGHAFSTLEPPGRRTVTVEGQQFLPGEPDKRLYPVHFCRDCGQEYHPVKQVLDQGAQAFLPRDIDDALPTPNDEDPEAADDASAGKAGPVFGFLTPHPSDADFTFQDRDEDYPESWLEFDAAGNPRLKKHYRRIRAIEVNVSPAGKVGSGTKSWFIPGRFRFCLRCGTVHSTAARDRNRLASLSAEGRSSATTVLVASTLRWMHGDSSGLDRHTRKLLGFTDNRQDAALQSGHFNDFHFVSLVRSGFLGALEQAGDRGLRASDLGLAQQKALGFDRADPTVRAEWLLDPDLKGANRLLAEETLRDILAYRVWFDQRRGWRFTNPNLEQLGLVTAEYLTVDELAKDDEAFADAPDLLRLASPAVREALLLELCDYLRKSMAIDSVLLQQEGLKGLAARSHNWLRPPWGFAADESPRGGRWLMVSAPHFPSQRDQDLVVRGGARSALGRILRSSVSPSGRRLWDDIATVRSMKARQFDEVIEALLKAAALYGLVKASPTPFDDMPGWRLVESVIVFRRATPDAEPQPGRNAFFRDLFANLAATLREPAHPLFGFEAREHTAQVDGEKRSAREKRFRFGPKEREDLAKDEKHLRDIGEANRFLPVLFCSPTMELGVDISALNAVYLRNVPPTPANYAQRSGRAGRSGQAALVVTYCSAQGPHDQYFFREPKAMVHGEVRAPLLDLANRDLVESHLQAVWLACTGTPLNASIAELLVLPDLVRPLKAALRDAMAQPRVGAEATRRIARVLDLLEADLDPRQAPWYPGRDAFAAQVVRQALDRFDHAFDRWRDLFLAAEHQRDAARKTMDDYSAPPVDKRAAQGRHAQAIDQLNLLQKGTSTLSSDFYTYRYLATEGFLPGYNFPRLPLMAYIPATQDGRGRQAFLQRPRFLALSEFGPRSLVYHEGRAFRVVRALLALGSAGGAIVDTNLPTRVVRICKACGAAHFTDDVSMCHACKAPLGDAEIVNNVFRIENVGTMPAERITANDEERQRQGFELQTTFEWALRDGGPDFRPGTASDAEGVIVRLAYGPGATITRLNKGLRRRANRSQYGFRIDPLSGYWARNEDEEGTVEDPMAAPRQWIVPSVQDRKNALLLQPALDDLSLEVLATVQHALVRGIEAVFQLEEGEILAEPLPSRDTRHGFLFYEAAEGGAGVLTRLVSEPDQLAEVAREALAILHFDLSGGLPANAADLVEQSDTACVAACYRCLMSYYNQPDHELLDRRVPQARELLLRLARATTNVDRMTVSADPAAAPDAPVVTDPVLARWYQAARTRELPVPDARPLETDGHAIPLVWRDHYVAAVLDLAPTPATNGLRDRGFEIIAFGPDETTWDEGFDRLAKALGRAG